jgi:hypothetical protein
MSDLKVQPTTFAGALGFALIRFLCIIYFGSALVGAAQTYASSQRYQMVGMQREHGLSLAFDTATGEVVALPLPGAWK